MFEGFVKTFDSSINSNLYSEMDAEDEDLIPPTPPRQPCPAPREPSPTLQQLSPEPKPSTRVQKKKTQSPRKKLIKKILTRERNRIKNLVPKTYMDKDGFMGRIVSINESSCFIIYLRKMPVSTGKLHIHCCHGDTETYGQNAIFHKF